MILRKYKIGAGIGQGIFVTAVFSLLLTESLGVARAATLAELVKKAKQEGALNATIVSSLTGREAQQLAAAFKKRFGLDIDATITPILNTRNYPNAIAEIKSGAVPTYDAIEGSDTNNMALLGVGWVLKIDGWERESFKGSYA